MDENSSFFAKWFAYFAVVPSGDDARTAMAYDSDNRTFNETFFGSGYIQTNLTLSQEGSTPTWSGEFNNTGTSGLYNLTNLWINDTSNGINSTVFSNINFTVTSIPDYDAPYFITIPSNASTCSG